MGLSFGAQGVEANYTIDVQIEGIGGVGPRPWVMITGISTLALVCGVYRIGRVGNWLYHKGAGILNAIHRATTRIVDVRPFVLREWKERVRELREMRAPTYRELVANINPFMAQCTQFVRSLTPLGGIRQCESLFWDTLFSPNDIVLVSGQVNVDDLCRMRITLPWVENMDVVVAPLTWSTVKVRAPWLWNRLLPHLSICDTSRRIQQLPEFMQSAIRFVL